MEKAFNKHWNATRWNVDGYSIEFQAHVIADVTSTTFFGADGDNEIEITDEDARSHVNGLTDSGGLLTIKDLNFDWTVAHESGHLMGLPDDYTDEGEVSVPDPGHDNHMMAEVGAPVVDHEVRDFSKGKIKCKCQKGTK
jgi:hypothetical protein